AWWVELNGVGTANANGKFVSAYAGDMNTINSIAVENGELIFTIQSPAREGKAAPPKFVYRAKLANGKLVGTMQTDGSSNPPIQFTGVRAPEIKEQDDGSWKE